MASWVLIKDSADPVDSPRKHSSETETSRDAKLRSLLLISTSSCCFSRSCSKARGLYPSLGWGSRNWDAYSVTGVACWRIVSIIKGLYTDEDWNWGSDGLGWTGSKDISCAFSCWSATIACGFPNTKLRSLKPFKQENSLFRHCMNAWMTNSQRLMMAITCKHSTTVGPISTAVTNSYTCLWQLHCSHLV